MTPTEIKQLFLETIEKPDFKEKSGATKHQLYNYRHRTTKVSLMLEILLIYQHLEVLRFHNLMPYLFPLKLFSSYYMF